MRHVPAGNNWHKATDNLAGTEEYGDPRDGPDSTQAWSIKFDEAIFDQFLFSTGDCSKWLITTWQAVRAPAADEPRQIIKSSTSADPYTAKWYNRPGGPAEDPWVSLTDHGPATAAGDILYGENSFGSGHATNVLPAKKGNGANVYIRSKSGRNKPRCG